MRTVDKALKLLNHFSTVTPEWGLSEMSRAAGLDKATVLRMLNALAAYGLLEQHPESRKYRLGKAVLRLARVREACFPVVSVIQPVLDRLSLETGETAHASLASEAELMTVGAAEPQRTTRVHIDPAEPLPLHATASGLAYLAYARPEARRAALAACSFTAHTGRTLTRTEDLENEIARARSQGYAICEGSFEADVIGVAAPVFDWSGHACGAIAVASLISRFTPDLRLKVSRLVVSAAAEITRAMGGEPHPDLLRAEREAAA